MSELKGHSSSADSATAYSTKKSLPTKPIPKLNYKPCNWHEWINAIIANFSDCPYIQNVLELRKAPANVGILAIAEFYVKRVESQAILISLGLDNLILSSPRNDQDSDDDQLSFGQSTSKTPRDSKGRFAKRDPSTVKATPFTPESASSITATTSAIKLMIAASDQDGAHRMLKELSRLVPPSLEDATQFNIVAEKAAEKFREHCALVLQVIFNGRSLDPVLEQQLRSSMIEPTLPAAMKSQDLAAIIGALYRICMPTISGITLDICRVLSHSWEPTKTRMYGYLDELDRLYDRVMELSPDHPPAWDTLKVSQTIINLSKDPHLQLFTQPMLTSGDIPKTPGELRRKLIDYVNAQDLVEHYNGGGSTGGTSRRKGAQQSSTFAVQSQDKKDKKKPTCHFCHKPGHTQSECYSYRDAAALAQKSKSRGSSKTRTTDSSVSSVSTASTAGSSKKGKKHSHKGRKGAKSDRKSGSRHKDKKVSFVNMVSKDDNSVASASSSDDSCVFYTAARVDAYYDPDLPPDQLIYVDSCASEHTLCPKAAPKVQGGILINFAANERLHLSTGNGSIRPTHYVSVPKMGDCIILPKMKTNLFSFPRALATGFYWELERIGPGYVAYDLYRSDDNCFIARFDQTPFGWATELSKLVHSLQSPTGGSVHAAMVFTNSVTGNKRPHPGPSPVELKRAEEVLLLHQSMNCTSLRTIKVMLQSGTIVDTHLTARDVDVCLRHLPACPICLAVKSRAAPRPTSTKEPVRRIGERVHCDLFFIFKSIFLLFVDGFTNFAGGIVLRSKAISQIRRGLTTVSNFFLQMGNPVGVFSWDREPGAVALDSLHEFRCVFSAAEGHELTCERFAQTTRLAAYACYKRQSFRVAPS